MRKGKCDFEYRFDGKNFLFKRPRVIKDPGPPKTSKEDSHEKTLRDYDRKVQKRVNRGQHMKIMGENQFVKGNTLNPVSNTIMR